MEQGYFITGTDTNAGKTWATVTLIEYFKNRHKSVVALKPVASGCDYQNGRLVNADALLLQRHASIELAYEVVNPYAYAAPISPHLAGKQDPADIEVIANCCQQVKESAQIILVEGAGGWYSPLNNLEKNSGLAKKLRFPIIVVVGIKLGCINHALLTCRAIANEGLVCAGWLAVCNDAGTLAPEEIIASLKEMLSPPLLGVLPYLAEPDFKRLANLLTLDVGCF